MSRGTRHRPTQWLDRDTYVQWARNYGIKLNGVSPARMPGTGNGLVTTRSIKVIIGSSSHWLQAAEREPRLAKSLSTSRPLRYYPLSLSQSLSDVISLAAQSMVSSRRSWPWAKAHNALLPGFPLCRRWLTSKNACQSCGPSSWKMAVGPQTCYRERLRRCWKNKERDCLQTSNMSSLRILNSSLSRINITGFLWIREPSFLTCCLWRSQLRGMIAWCSAHLRTSSIMLMMAYVGPCIVNKSWCWVLVQRYLQCARIQHKSRPRLW